MIAPKINIKLRFGDGVRERRLELGLSQEALAEKATLHRTYIGHVERGEKNISLENIAKVANALDITIGQFFVDYVDSRKPHHG